MQIASCLKNFTILMKEVDVFCASTEFEKIVGDKTLNKYGYQPIIRSEDQEEDKPYKPPYSTLKTELHWFGLVRLKDKNKYRLHFLLRQLNFPIMIKYFPRIPFMSVATQYFFHRNNLGRLSGIQKTLFICPNGV